MTVQVNVYEAKTHLSQLLERVLAGERVVISKAGKPIVDLIRHEAAPIRFDGLRAHLSYDDAQFEAADAEVAALFDFDDAAS